MVEHARDPDRLRQCVDRQQPARPVGAGGGGWILVGAPPDEVDITNAVDPGTLAPTVQMPSDAGLVGAAAGRFASPENGASGWVSIEGNP